MLNLYVCVTLCPLLENHTIFTIETDSGSFDLGCRATNWDFRLKHNRFCSLNAHVESKSTVVCCVSPWVFMITNPSAIEDK